MDSEAGNLAQLAHVSRRLFRRVLTIGENRAELLLVELEEERDRLFLAIIIALGIAVFGLLAGVSLTIIIAIAFWDRSPIVAMGVLTVLYLAAATLLYSRLVRMKKTWQTLAATMDQIRKDRECLERTLT